jgi:hypothetical protein
VVAAPPAAQPADRVATGEDEAGDHERGEIHVHELVCQEAVAEQRCHRLDVDHPAALHAETRRVLHPCVDRDHGEGTGDTGDHDRQAADEVPARRQPVPPVDVDADEDRLHEEREALDGEPETEHGAERPSEARPQQAHLEAEDGAGHHAHREQGDQHPAPALREGSIDGVTGAEVPPLEEKDHQRERHPEADERDVHHERQRLHLAALIEVRLFHCGQAQAAHQAMSGGRGSTGLVRRRLTARRRAGRQPGRRG